MPKEQFLIGVHGLCLPLSFFSLWFFLFLCLFLYVNVYVISRCLPQVCVHASTCVCACLSVWVSMHEVCISTRLCVYVSLCVCFAHSLHLTRAQIIEDGKTVSGKSPGLPPSDLEPGRALARCPRWLFLGQAPGCLGIYNHFPTPGLSGS